MNSFRKNSISYNYKTAGEQLFLARKKQNLKLKKISKKINISVEYLKFLENGNFDKLPEGIYREKILKKYSEFLNLDQSKIAKTFVKEKNINSSPEKKIPSPKNLKAY
ncbi:helix-turn-helix domain-containing protein, partial [bacterium]|nr:helix-turn-helix domain-containing protein [bacterium]